MRNPVRTIEQFFYEHAGYSYRPDKETQDEGRLRCAAAYAIAERLACEAGYSFHWSIDQDIDSSDWSDDPDPWQLWECVMRHLNGDVCASLSGIDFGRDGKPWSDPYRRVVEAELASEVFP